MVLLEVYVLIMSTGQSSNTKDDAKATCGGGEGGGVGFVLSDNSMTSCFVS